MTKLIVSNVSVNAGKTALVKDASLSLQPGELIALLGPNGAGKSSLLKASLGITSPTTGSVTLGEDNIQTLSPITRAQRIAYLPQTRPLAWPNTVRDIVALGRYAYGSNLGRLAPEDAKQVDHAIEQCSIGHLVKRKADTLSGGELARVHCARAFAANAPLLIADEPVAALDPQHQYKVLEIIRRYVDDGNGALIVLHDMALAAQFVDRIIWMKDGAITADGTVLDTLTEQRLADVFGIKATVDGRKVVIEGAY